MNGFNIAYFFDPYVLLALTGAVICYGALFIWACMALPNDMPQKIDADQGRAE